MEEMGLCFCIENYRCTSSTKKSTHGRSLLWLLNYRSWKNNIELPRRSKESHLILSILKYVECLIHRNTNVKKEYISRVYSKHSMFYFLPKIVRPKMMLSRNLFWHVLKHLGYLTSLCEQILLNWKILK